VETILEMGNRVAASLKKLSSLDDAPTREYLAGGARMVDLQAVHGDEGA
jgi:hypothetical protein